jgi:predicted NUDIX family phosphoesterase
MYTDEKLVATSDDSLDEREQQTYLRVAEIVLGRIRSPLKAREIVDQGIDLGLFGDHRLSRTPEKSMQARLSMDIINRTNQSKFVRTERGKFTLRSNMSHRSSSTEQAGAVPLVYEYVAERRVLQTPKEELLCVPERAFREVLTFQGIDTDAGPILDHLFINNSTLYVPRSEAEVRNDAKQFVTYVLLQSGPRLLFFRRSYLSRAAEFLRGSRCVGFGGHVSADDFLMWSREDNGLEACARRELSEELHLNLVSVDKCEYAGAPNYISRKTISLFREVSLELLGILNDDSSEVGRRHVAVIYRAWVTDWNLARLLGKGDSSIKALGWIDITKETLDISDFEYWSQLCLRKFYPSTVIARTKFKILNSAKPSSDRVIVVSGRIGSGKTETASYLSQKLRCPLVRSSKVLQELMEVPPISEIGRREFQTRALEFIRRDGGPERLADKIAMRVSESSTQHCIVDGIRHLTTYESLESHFNGKTSLIFVQTPPDVAYDMYRAREVDAHLAFNYREFLEIYDAPGEAEISSLGRKAQVYIYNSFGIEAFRRTLDEVARRISGNDEEIVLDHRPGKSVGSLLRR